MEFTTIKFEGGLGSPKKTNYLWYKIKNEFKDIMLVKLDSLIKWYREFISLNPKAKKISAESLDNSYSIVKFDKKAKNN